MLYVASFGPAFWLADRDVLSFTSILRAYPLLYRCVWEKDKDLWHQGLFWYATVGRSSKSDVEIEVRVYKAQLAITEQRSKNTDRSTR